MRITHTLVLVLPLVLAACSAEAPPPGADPAATADTSTANETGSVDGTVYGEPIGDAPLVTLAELTANVADYEGQRVRVEGLIIDVCAKRGCWMNIGAEEGSDYVRFKVVDGVMVFPMDAVGAQAEVEGTVQRLEYDLETTRKVLAHEAEESGEEFDESTVTEPMVVVQLAGIGAVVRPSE
jgi:hypothetical protein